MSEPAKKRYCENLTYDTVLSAFEQLNAQIESHYSSSSKLIHEEGLKYLERLTKQYLRLKGRQTQGEGENCHQWINENKLKELVVEEEAADNVPVSIRKQRVSECKPKKEVSSNRRKQQSEKLKEKIAKVEEEYWGEDWEAASNDNLMDFKNEDELKGKTLSQIIEASVQKAKEDLKPCPESDCEYDITDYSSNGSSNQNDYELVFKENNNSQSKKQTSLFGGLFQNDKSQSLSSIMSISEGFKTKFGEKLNFEPSFLINSPKKDKQVSKRLYIHQKRIPRWAEDLVEVSKEVERQAKTGKNPLSIYGVCVVEQLNTNVIFRLKEDFQRHSSAKWDKEVLGQCR